ncbi:Outer membrane protein V [Pseudomonas chlororaphis subsp. aurantiaca]|nr:Outer membrane protein V [Pseudomonas chlororaphis subsp. aurantiaca]
MKTSIRPKTLCLSLAALPLASLCLLTSSGLSPQGRLSQPWRRPDLDSAGQ